MDKLTATFGGGFFLAIKGEVAMSTSCAELNVPKSERLRPTNAMRNLAAPPTRRGTHRRGRLGVMASVLGAYDGLQNDLRVRVRAEAHGSDTEHVRTRGDRIEGRVLGHDFDDVARVVSRERLVAEDGVFARGVGAAGELAIAHRSGFAGTFRVRDEVDRSVEPGGIRLVVVAQSGIRALRAPRNKPEGVEC